MRRFALILAAVLSPTVSLAQNPEEKAALATLERVFEGMRTADSAMVRTGFADGARFASVDARTTPATIKYDTIDGWLRGIANSNRRWDEQIFDVQVRVDGNVAQIWAPYTFYLDKKVRHCGVDTAELLKDGAGWKITQLSDTQRRENCKDPLAGK